MPPALKARQRERGMRQPLDTIAAQDASHAQKQRVARYPTVIRGVWRSHHTGRRYEEDSHAVVCAARRSWFCRRYGGRISCSLSWCRMPCLRRRRPPPRQGTREWAAARSRRLIPVLVPSIEGERAVREKPCYAETYNRSLFSGTSAVSAAGALQVRINNQGKVGRGGRPQRSQAAS